MDLKEQARLLEDKLKMLHGAAALQEKQARERAAFASKMGYSSWEQIEQSLGGQAAPAKASKAKAPKAAPAKPARKRAKLDDKQRSEIVAAYKNRGDTPVAQVAKKFGVSEVTVYALVNKAKGKK